MKVELVASTVIERFPAATRETRFAEEVWEWDSEHEGACPADVLSELAGRGCYQAWDKKNPNTQTNATYLDSIQRQNHTSVFEHATVSFYVSDVSRAMLLELERHRHISFSVESQRYVDVKRFHPNVVVPPLYRDAPEGSPLANLGAMLQEHYEASVNLYDVAYIVARDEGATVKESREAARAYLPESTGVNFLVSGNLRAWRDVLGKRYAVDADAEIREFAGLVLEHLREVAPNSFQDFPTKPFGTEAAA